MILRERERDDNSGLNKLLEYVFGLDLVSYGYGVKYKKLGELINNLPKGTLKTTDLIPNGKYPVINSGTSIYGYYYKFNNNGDAITIASRGENASFVQYMDQDFWAGGLCYALRSKDDNEILTKFLYYYLKNTQQKIRETLVSEGSIPALNKKDLEDIIIPIPPLSLQNQIVAILDNFSTYTNNLTQGLPAEINLRQKQYEYYRNKLLSFNKVS
ncbi:type I restriction endonuclease [Mycoplasmopsis bovirhinis]|uniref:restriction endonuclease subunit S n=1 Tax=Mycoplasmopsis bovirhinis TaxID=29553 RepID=UPI000BB9DA02|nr:restriction endonuclease subunit S [Mycoplasmopsis bovirhinis]BBA22126.1 type I restriction endonuclease [Mycoplasmopsis bovirhinis]